MCRSCRMLLSEIHETEALLNQSDPSSGSTISVLFLATSCSYHHLTRCCPLIFKFLRNSLLSPLLSFTTSSFLHDSGLDKTAIDAPLPVFLYGPRLSSSLYRFVASVESTMQMESLGSLEGFHVLTMMIRYYSHQWRAWGTCFIQAAWRRYIKRKLGRQEQEYGYFYYDDDGGGYHQYEEIMPESSIGGNNVDEDNNNNNQNLGATILASKFAANTRRGLLGYQRGSSRIDPTLKMFKREDPRFF